MRDGGGWARGGNHETGEKQWDFESILSIEPTGFADGLGFGAGREVSSRSVTRSMRQLRKQAWGEDEQFSLAMLRLEGGLSDIQAELCIGAWTCRAGGQG